MFLTPECLIAHLKDVVSQQYFRDADLLGYGARCFAYLLMMYPIAL